MARGRIARDRRDGRITDREGLDRALGRRGNPAQEQLLSLQKTAGNQAVVQRFREYDDVVADGEMGSGKRIDAPGLHYTVNKPTTLPGHFNEFHLTYHAAVKGNHPHFYFTDTAQYLPTWEHTAQNKNWIEARGREKFDEFRDDAKTKAEAKVKELPVYEGATKTAVDAAHAKKAADAAEAAADAAKEAAGIKTVVATTTKVKPKANDCTKFADAMKDLTGATSATAVAKGNSMVATLVFAGYKGAKDGQLLLAKQLYNTKPVTAELGSA